MLLLTIHAINKAKKLAELPISYYVELGRSEVIVYWENFAMKAAEFWKSILNLGEPQGSIWIAVANQILGTSKISGDHKVLLPTQ